MEEAKASFDIVFVSSFGRHHWLARELALNHWEVGHIDVSDLLGSWGEQDLRNPFGLSKISHLNPEQISAWHTMAQAQKISNGVSLLLEHGPFEASGPLRDFFKTRLQINNHAESLLRENSLAVLGSNISQLNQKIQAMGFEDLWLVNLSRQLASSIYLENAQAYELGGGVPIFDELYKDCSTPDTRSSAKAFKGIDLVKNFEPSHLAGFKETKNGFFELDLDMAFEGGARSSGLYKQNIKTRVLVWALTSAETEYLSHDSVKTLFTGKKLDPIWSWQRFSFSGPSEVVAAWPIQFYSLEHLRLPWSHDNLTLISKKSANSFDVWMRIPCIFRFNSDYQYKLSEQFRRKLASRFTSNDFQVVDLPLESRATKAQLGPPRWPVYSLDDVSSLKPMHRPYLIFESSELLRTHQAQAQLIFQNNLFLKLMLMRRQWLKVEAKVKQKIFDREIRTRG